ncbi:MAG: NUDIX hydrolase [Candidatus Paceibacterota bacterium]
MNAMPNCFYRVSVKALVLNKTKDKFLVCKESSGYWEIPGGGLDWGETHKEGLSREIEEEMGLKVKSLAENPCYFLTGEQSQNPGVRFANIVYECELEHLDFKPSDECMEITFVDAEDIKSMKVFGSVVRLANMFNPENHR